MSSLIPPPEITAAILVVLVSFAGVALTALTLPGIWIAILGALGTQWWSMARDGSVGGAGSGAALPPDAMFSWWTLGVVVLLALIAEATELAASAFGAAKAGGTRRGAIGSIIGGLVGALGGTFILPIPVLGTLVGAALGAGGGALIAERHGGQKTWGESSKIGAGAAVGRLVATFIKVGFALVIAVILSVAAFV